MGIGSILQKLINDVGTNVNEVSIATNVSPQTLYSIIKRDSMKANIDDLYKVARYLGVTLDYFYSGYLTEQNRVTTPAKNKSEDNRLSEIIDIYNEMNEEGKAHLHKTARHCSYDPEYKKPDEIHKPA